MNTELNDLRISIYLRKSEVTVETISVCIVIENWRSVAYSLSCSYATDVINMLQATVTSY